MARLIYSAVTIEGQSPAGLDFARTWQALAQERRCGNGTVYQLPPA